MHVNGNIFKYTGQKRLETRSSCKGRGILSFFNFFYCEEDHKQKEDRYTPQLLLAAG